MIKRSNSNKGITLIALIITIVISLLLIVSITVSVDNVKETSQYYKIKDDIVALQKQVQLYYLENGELPLQKNIRDGDFHKTILGYSIDRNPNDNDTYYVLYDGTDEIPKEYYGDKLPEVNIQSKTSKYVVNSKSLTVYCTTDFTIDGQQHYTASSDFSGGRFASEYYQDIGVIDLADIRMGVSTDTVININGVDKAYPNYAKSDSIIAITLSTKDMDIYNANGEAMKDVKFSSFEKKPSVNSFKITITALEDEKTVYLSKKAATSIDYTLDGGQTCKIYFDLSKYGLNTSNMTSRRKITFSYDNNYDFYYNISNRIDYNMMMNNYLKLNTIEFENNAEEIIIASTMNSSEGTTNFVSNIKNVSTKDKSGNSKKWEGKYTYTNIITAPSGQKYVINDSGKDFYKAYTITLNLVSYPSDVPQNNIKIIYTVDGKSYTTSTDKTIDAIKDKSIGTTIQVSGFNSKSPSYTMGSANRTESVTLDAIQYTFTLKSNTSGSALALTNTTRSSTFAASGSTSDQTRTVSAYIGDQISYKVTKDYYRFSDQVRKEASEKTYTMVASNETKTVTLAQNIFESKYNIDDIHVDYDSSSTSNDGTGTIGENKRVTKVDLSFKIKHSCGIYWFKNQGCDVEFQYTNQPLLKNEKYQKLASGTVTQKEYNYTLYEYKNTYEPPESIAINKNTNNVYIKVTKGKTEWADLKDIYITVSYAVK